MVERKVHPDEFGERRCAPETIDRLSDKAIGDPDPWPRASIPGDQIMRSIG
jgi:hypothetical protein